MQLEDLFDYKNRLMEDLMTRESIVRLLDDDIPMESAGELIYKQVFPFEYLPETVQDGHTFICCDVDVQSAPTKTFLIPTLYIWEFSHRSKLVLPDHSGVRTDKLCAEICKAINGSRFYGLGQLNISAVKRFAPMTDFNGKCLIFRMKEFNRQYDGTQTIPSNRKSY